MDKKALQHFKKSLLNKKSKYESTMNMMNEHSEGKQNMYDSSELSNYDNHPADLGSEVAELGINNALKVHEEYNIGQVDEALERIEDGTYGLCEVCGIEISKERLDALPFARKCMHCEKKNNIEMGDNKFSRPVEEQVIGSPFGRKYLNKQEDDEHEGMDILNDLMKYGSADTPQDMGGYKDYEEFYNNNIDNQGIVEDIDKLSNDDYIRQLPD